MQAITRNPLAEPGLLGLSAGANAMLAISLVFIPGLSYFGIIIVCFIGALIGTVLVFSISAAKKGAVSPLELFLLVQLFLHFYMQLSKESDYISRFLKIFRCGPRVV